MPNPGASEVGRTGQGRAWLQTGQNRTGQGMAHADIDGALHHNTHKEFMSERAQHRAAQTLFMLACVLGTTPTASIASSSYRKGALPAAAR